MGGARAAGGNDTVVEIQRADAEGADLTLTAPSAPVTAGGSPRPTPAPAPGPEVAAVAPKSR